MISIEYSGMNEKTLRELFGDAPVQKALVRTQNRVLASVNTAMNREARKTYAIKARDINSTKKIKRANAKNQDAVLSYIGERLPLKLFKPSSRRIKVNTKRGPATRRQVSVRIKKTGRIKITSIPAFLIKSGDVMYRTTEERTPIKTAMTISVPEMMSTQEQQENFEKTVAERFPVEFERNMDFYLSKL